MIKCCNFFSSIVFLISFLTSFLYKSFESFSIKALKYASVKHYDFDLIAVFTIYQFYNLLRLKEFQFKCSSLLFEKEYQTKLFKKKLLIQPNIIDF